jgi:hypothetical protein
VYPTLQRFLILAGVFSLAAACDPNVVIGAKWIRDDGGLGGQVSSGGTLSSAGGGSGGTETVSVGASGSGEGGVPEAGGAGGAPAVREEWCATAPWLNKPVSFTNDNGDVIPSGSYVISYVSGAQIHDLDIGYEVTGHYFGKNALEAGHHVFSGQSPETGSTSLWLIDTGLVAGGSLAEVEQANRGHTWPLEHAGGELFITLYDDDYHDNSGPGSRLCISSAAP